MRWIGVWATLLCVVAGAEPAVGQAIPVIERSGVDSVFRRYGPTTPGCALNILRNDSSLYATGYGRASLEWQRPITPATVFDLASGSKQFTAASIALLVLDGKLSLDDDVRRYVPELPDLGGVVTLRELLSHTSGWRDYVQMLVWHGLEVRDRATEIDALGILMRQRALNFAPGTDYRYSNTGYLLLGIVVHRVSGLSLAEFARTRIFEPLGMRDTRYMTGATEVVQNLATGYAPTSTGGWSTSMSNWELSGDGGVQTTIGDLARWNANFSSGRVGGPALREMLEHPGSLADGTPIPYGLGLFIDQYRGQRRIWHNGIWAGYRSILMRFPDAGVAIALLCNSTDANTELLADAVADRVVPGLAPLPAPTRKLVPPDRSAADVAGTYYSDHTNLVIELVTDSGAVGLAGAPPTWLMPDGARGYRLGSGIHLGFSPASGKATAMIAINDGRRTPYIRVAPALPSSRYVEYVGRYHSSEVDVYWTIVVIDNVLTLRDSHGVDLKLRPIFADAFDGTGTMRFLRDRRGRVTALTMTTRGVQGLRFARIGNATRR